jgi:hypothetical protein
MSWLKDWGIMFKEVETFTFYNYSSSVKLSSFYNGLNKTGASSSSSDVVDES